MSPAFFGNNVTKVDINKSENQYLS